MVIAPLLDMIPDDPLVIFLLFVAAFGLAVLAAILRAHYGEVDDTAWWDDRGDRED